MCGTDALAVAAKMNKTEISPRAPCYFLNYMLKAESLRWLFRGKDE